MAALRVTQISLDEIATLNQRLAELGALNSNNSLLSTNDTASLNKETASITTAIDNIVANTKYNNIALMGTNDIDQHETSIIELINLISNMILYPNLV